MSDIKVLSVTSELYPLIKTGGLADVAGALPLALAQHHVDMRTLIPGYPSVKAALKDWAIAHSFRNLFGGKASLLYGEVAGLKLYVLDAPHLFDRPGNPYLSPDGTDWPDNPQRFAALSRVGADIGKGLLKDFRPAIVHSHDWQAGFIPAYLHYDGGARPKTVMTVHNLAFQGRAPAEMLHSLALPPNSFTMDGVEYFGDISALKSGLQFADSITTVSPTYAKEIREPDAGMGLDGLLEARKGALVGILNGVDTQVWNPATDALLPASFEAKSIAGRAKSKAALQKRLGLKVDAKAPVFGVISRLSWQKGLDLLLEALPLIAGEGAQLALLGSGDKDLEAAYTAAMARYPGQVGCIIGYDEGLAHLLQAGSDVILVPSRFEPCGLTQLCALRYGAVPLVARVGGLNDTVIDANDMALAAGVATGIQFGPVTGGQFQDAVRRTLHLYRQPKVWKQMQANGLKTDVSWLRPAAQYAELYRNLIAK